MCFTDWVPDLEIQYNIGFLVMACSGFQLFTNMFFIIAESVHQGCLRVKRWRLMRKYAKTRGEQMLHKEKKVREINFKR